MQYWRMQLHPDQSNRAAAHAAESLSAGMIGLDHEEEIGDMRYGDRNRLPPHQRDYLDLATRMQRDDRLLIIVHHYPFAFATIDSDYFYITQKQPELKIWFRHFRRVRNVRYVADVITNPQLWPNLKMTDTICCLTSDDSDSLAFLRTHYP